MGIAVREDVLGVITNVILVIWGPRGSAGHRGSTGGFPCCPPQLASKILPGQESPRSKNLPVARISPAPGEHLAHLPFLGPQLLLLMLFEISNILVNWTFYARIS